MDHDPPLPPSDSPDDELPSYHHLEAEANAEGGQTAARWNRWRGWIEKRAAERYAQDPSQAKRPSGWGPSVDDGVAVDGPSDADPASYGGSPRRQNTEIAVAPPDYTLPSPAGSPGQLLEPSRLSLHNFGSRFLPHATDRIHCMLPILSDKFLLVGTAEGLSVLDVHPSLHPKKGNQPLALNTNLNAQPLADAVSIPIWIGEAVYQLDLLEDANSEATIDNPQGVVLALVGPADDDSNRAVRMYNFASLVSLVRWYVAQQDHPPLDVQRTLNPPTGNPTNGKQRIKKPRPQSELAKGIKSLIVDELKVSSATGSPTARERGTSPLRSPIASTPRAGGVSPYPSCSPTPSQRSLLPNGSSPPNPPAKGHVPRSPSQTSVASSSWDIIDEMPVRWASDYVQFAGPGSRLANIPVAFYELWKSKDAKIPTSLAIATRTNILLYETPRSERAFKFVKEFYTPMSARSVSFVQQADPMQPSRATNRTSNNIQPVQNLGRRSSTGHGSTRSRNVDYGTQLCLFVAFEKKAGLIRVGDAAVMEVEVAADAPAPTTPMTHRPRHSTSSFTDSPVSPSNSGGSLRRRIVNSLDGGDGGFFKSYPPWLPLFELVLPPLIPPNIPSALPDTPRPITPPDSICFITRGRTTSIYPVPIPMSYTTPSSSSPPLKILIWDSQPSRLLARVSMQPTNAVQDNTPSIPAPAPPFLQVLGFGDSGVEIQELSFNFLFQQPKGKGKGKARDSVLPDPIVRAFADVGGPAGSLGCGGQWNRPRISAMDGPQVVSPMIRQDSWASIDTYSPSTSNTYSPASVSSHAYSRPPVEVGGVYGWAMRGMEDYRIFWLGEGSADIAR